MKKRFISCVAIIMMFSFSVPYVCVAKSVSELKSEMQKRQNERKAFEKEINSKKDERDEQIKERNSLDIQISGVMEDIDHTQGLIDEKQGRIDELNVEIEKMNKAIDENTEKLKQRMKIMYEYGATSYLELILESEGIGDFFNRVSVVRDIVRHDRNLIDSYKDAKMRIEDVKAEVQKEMDEQVSARDLLEGKKNELKGLQDKKDALISELNSDIKYLEEKERKAEEDYNSLKNELDRALGNSSSPAYTGNGKFVWPSAASTRVTSEFGYRNKPNAKATSNHRGIDIGAPSGTNVLAAEAGTVVTAGYNRSYGYYITINHGGGYVTLYAHNSRLLVSKGDKVTRGQVIAKVGSTGNSTGPHIHFEVMVNGVCKNPRNFF